MIKEEIKRRLEKNIKDWVVKNPKRIYFTIESKDLKETVKLFYQKMKLRLSTVTGIDNLTNFELIYHFSCDKTGELFNLRVFLSDRDKPEIDSLCDIFESSNWVEREIHEMLGIKFKGHPNLTHLLLDDTWPKNKYPLRKDYSNE
ncbi:MAG: NADH-quinone oxidoreductase subunit C [Candidatus Omnitrophica bacterium]|nr:NADH-quinone oxidoreductase subunit C [Candidatus Omnitrophota bacterium]